MPVVAPLDNVKRDVRQSQAGAARHVVCLLITEIERNLSLKPWSVPCCPLLSLHHTTFLSQYSIPPAIALDQRQDFKSLSVTIKVIGSNGDDSKPTRS